MLRDLTNLALLNILVKANNIRMHGMCSNNHKCVLKPGNDNNIQTSRDFLEIYPTLGFSPAFVSTCAVTKSRRVWARVNSSLLAPHLKISSLVMQGPDSEVMNASFLFHISYQLKQTLGNLGTARSVASNKNVLHPTNLHDSERGNLIVSVWSLDPRFYDQYFIRCPEFDQTKFP